MRRVPLPVLSTVLLYTPKRVRRLAKAYCRSSSLPKEGWHN
jgi:hypothetical protein